MKENIVYNFSPEKNAKLKNERGISFEEIIAAIDAGYLLKDEIFLKTIFPSRKLTKQYEYFIKEKDHE